MSETERQAPSLANWNARSTVPMRVSLNVPADNRAIARDAVVGFRQLTTKVYAVQACSRLQYDLRRCSMATPFGHPLLKTIRASLRWPFFVCRTPPGAPFDIFGTALV